MVFNRIMVVMCLLGLAALLLVRTATSQMALYIHPRYEVLMYICAGVVFALALALLSTPGRLPPLTMPIIAIPVVLGLLVVPRPLGSASMLQQASALNRVAQRSDMVRQFDLQDTTIDTKTWSLYDWAVVSSVDAAAVAGRDAQVSGFVVFPPDMQLSQEQFMLARYVITCCTADAGGVGMRVIWPAATQLANDQWVEVTGTTVVADIDGVETIFLQAQQVVPIDPPTIPYLTPDVTSASSPD